MTITINGKDYQMYFGLDFISHLDKKYNVKEDGLGFVLGQGLVYVSTQIEMGNPLILIDLIEAGTATGEKPKTENIKKFIETEADIEVLMNDFLSHLETAPTTHFMLKKLGLLPEKKNKKVK